MSLSPQLLMNTIAGCRPGVVDSMTFALRTTPSRAVMSTERNPVVDAVEADTAVVAAARVPIRVRPNSAARRPARMDAMGTSQTAKLLDGNPGYRRVTSW